MDIDSPTAARSVPTELICLPEDLAHLNGNAASEDAAAPSPLEFEIPVALMHPSVLFDVLSAANITSVMDSLPDSERQELLAFLPTIPSDELEVLGSSPAEFLKDTIEDMSAFPTQSSASKSIRQSPLLQFWQLLVTGRLHPSMQELRRARVQLLNDAATAQQRAQISQSVVTATAFAYGLRSALAEAQKDQENMYRARVARNRERMVLQSQANSQTAQAAQAAQTSQKPDALAASPELAQESTVLEAEDEEKEALKQFFLNQQRSIPFPTQIVALTAHVGSSVEPMDTDQAEEPSNTLSDSMVDDVQMQ